MDDEPAVRAVLAGGLALHGHQVTEAGGAGEALALLEAGERPEVLVTDLAMPGEMDGLALIRAVRDRLPGLPAILITGHAGDAAQGALAAVAGEGPFAVLRKPVGIDMVAGQLASLLGRTGAAETQIPSR
ncbi:response regulator [Falsiroseomonas sp. CW058]|uniref:response regulator n=1 Tax=Falsiroseomonas sp. CW058 TaxID=3388664 RepID=UPI003D3152D5